MGCGILYLPQIDVPYGCAAITRDICELFFKDEPLGTANESQEENLLFSIRHNLGMDFLWIGEVLSVPHPGEAVTQLHGRVPRQS